MEKCNFKITVLLPTGKKISRTLYGQYMKGCFVKVNGVWFSFENSNDNDVYKLNCCALDSIPPKYVTVNDNQSSLAFVHDSLMSKFNFRNTIDNSFFAHVK